MQVIKNPSFPQPSAGFVVLSIAVILVATGGLALLYLVTTTDPGFIPKGPEAAQVTASRQPGCKAERYSNYRCAWCVPVVSVQGLGLNRNDECHISPPNCTSHCSCRLGSTDLENKHTRRLDLSHPAAIP